MDPSTTIVALKALDGLAERSVVTAQNIANANTPDYRPLRTTFEAALKQAAVQGDSAVSELAPVTQSSEPDGADAQLRVDLELATASSTALRYSALVEMLARQGQIESAILSGGR